MSLQQFQQYGSGTYHAWNVVPFVEGLGEKCVMTGGLFNPNTFKAGQALPLIPFVTGMGHTCDDLTGFNAFNVPLPAERFGPGVLLPEGTTTVFASGDAICYCALSSFHLGTDGAHVTFDASKGQWDIAVEAKDVVDSGDQTSDDPADTCPCDGVTCDWDAWLKKQAQKYKAPTSTADNLLGDQPGFKITTLQFGEGIPAVACTATPTSDDASANYDLKKWCTTLSEDYTAYYKDGSTDFFSGGVSEQRIAVKLVDNTTGERLSTFYVFKTNGKVTGFNTIEGEQDAAGSPAPAVPAKLDLSGIEEIPAPASELFQEQQELLQSTAAAAAELQGNIANSAYAPSYGQAPLLAPASCQSHAALTVFLNTLVYNDPAATTTQLPATFCAGTEYEVDCNLIGSVPTHNGQYKDSFLKCTRTAWRGGRPTWSGLPWFAKHNANALFKCPPHLIPTDEPPRKITEAFFIFSGSDDDGDWESNLLDSNPTIIAVNKGIAWYPDTPLRVNEGVWNEFTTNFIEDKPNYWGGVLRKELCPQGNCDTYWRITFMGHSRGGMVAQAAALIWQNRFNPKTQLAIAINGAPSVFSKKSLKRAIENNDSIGTKFLSIPMVRYVNMVRKYRSKVSYADPIPALGEFTGFDFNTKLSGESLKPLGKLFHKDGTVEWTKSNIRNSEIFEPNCKNVVSIGLKMLLGLSPECVEMFKVHMSANYMNFAARARPNDDQ